MKRIFILTAGFGEGHNTAARSVRDALIQVGEHRVEPLYFDLFADCYGRLNELTRKAYLGLINHAPMIWEKIYALIDSTSMVGSNLVALSAMRRHLAALIAEHQPAAIVSTYPVYHYLLDQLRSRGEIPPLKQIMVVTDSISINSIWYRCHSDALLVPNEATLEVLVAAGVPAGRVHVTGFPVAPVFAEFAASRVPLSSGRDRRRVLFMINSGKKTAPALAAGLASRKDVDLTVTVGRDKALREAVEKAVAASANPVEILGWIDNMPALFSRSELLIGKAGGATVQESIAASCPIILTQVVPGQEEGNARLILENEAGALCEGGNDDVLQTVDDAFADNGKLLDQWRENISRISRPDSAMQAARFILNAIGE